jgi:hypothetical protein
VKFKRPETIQTALRLPVEMHEKLKQSELGVSEEIRGRLDYSFFLDGHDSDTRSLANAVLWMARQIQHDTGIAWHENAKASEALSVAFQTYLALTAQPPFKGPSIPDEKFVDDPATLGRAVARHCIANGKELQKFAAPLDRMAAGLKELVTNIRADISADAAKKKQQTKATKGKGKGKAKP